MMFFTLNKTQWWVAPRRSLLPFKPRKRSVTRWEGKPLLQVAWLIKGYLVSLQAGPLLVKKESITLLVGLKMLIICITMYNLDLLKMFGKLQNIIFPNVGEKWWFPMAPTKQIQVKGYSAPRLPISFWGCIWKQKKNDPKDLISLCQWTLKKKGLNFIFSTKYVIPKSLKFSHWPSKLPWTP